LGGDEAFLWTGGSKDNAKPRVKIKQSELLPLNSNQPIQESSGPMVVKIPQRSAAQPHRLATELPFLAPIPDAVQIAAATNCTAPSALFDCLSASL
jgi:hypothetical protein